MQDIAIGTEGRPWGFWATIGLAVVIMIAFLIGQIAAFSAFVAIQKLNQPEVDLKNYIHSLPSNGFAISIITCVTAPIVIGLSFLFAKMRKGIDVKEYFCLYKFTLKSLGFWVLIYILYSLVITLVMYIFKIPEPEFTKEIYRTAVYPALLLFTLCVAFPFYEELFFRGFLFKGIQSSRIGTTGAIILTSLAWAGMHVQYNPFWIFTIFIFGLILGIARAKTNSILLTMTMHSFMNLTSALNLFK